MDLDDMEYEINRLKERATKQDYTIDSLESRIADLEARPQSYSHNHLVPPVF